MCGRNGEEEEYNTRESDVTLIVNESVCDENSIAKGVNNVKEEILNNRK